MHALHAGADHKGLIVGALVLAVGLLLLAHGVAWGYAPLTVAGVVVAGVVAAHVAVAGLIAAALPGNREGGVLHRPHQYDRFARLIMLGGEARLRQWTLDLAQLAPGHAVLDVGCGTGTLLLAAAPRVGPGGRLCGVEPSPEMAAHARHKAAEQAVAVDVVEASADRLPHPDASFDVVFCTLALHHIPPEMREAALGEMRRVLRPGGRIVIVDWQRPTSIVAALTSPLSLVYAMHHRRPGMSPLEGLGGSMRAIGVDDVTRASFRGGPIGAVIGRTGAAGTSDGSSQAD